MDTLRMRSIRQPQRGAAFIVMLVIMIVGVTAFLVGSLNRSALQVKRDAVTARALAQAKEALIGYAVIYADTHAGSVPGYLPCPDPNGSVGINGEGSSETCGSTDVSAIGRLPWKTLGLSPVRDGNGECLWYAVAGSYKNNPMTSNLMNWDNNGLFQVLAASGVVVAGQTADSNAVAMILSPGVALSGQNRSPGGNAPLCGGNYTAANYLDGDVAISANNAAPSTAANAISQFFTAGATANINDQILFVTKADLFNAIARRNDFAAHISALMNDPYFGSVSISGTKGTDNVDCSAVTAGNQAFCTNWKEMLLIKDTTGSCNRVLLFGGQKTATQVRLTASDKSDPANYLEGSNLTAFATHHVHSGSLSGAAVFDANNPTADLLKCIP